MCHKNQKSVKETMQKWEKKGNSIERKEKKRKKEKVYGIVKGQAKCNR